VGITSVSKPPVAAARVASGRLHSLDGLRGIAALVVVTGHVLLFVPAVHTVLYKPGAAVHNPAVWLLAYTPLRTFWDGAQAVLLFFVLSGFVLALPFLHRSVGLREFWIRRALRIYPLYWLASVVALALLVVTFRIAPRGAGAAPWLGSWNAPVTPGLILNQLVLVGGNLTSVLDSAVWSLVHEMRISLIFPFLVVPFALWRPRQAAAAFVALVAVCYLTNHELARSQATDNYGSTFLYIPLFAAGALLARYRHDIARRASALAGRRQAVLAGAGVVLIAWPGLAASSALLHRTWTQEAAVTAGIALVIAVALADGPVRGFLESAPLQFLGRASYGVYLLHSPVIETLSRLFPQAPFWVNGLVGVAIVLPVAALLYRVFEQPFIRLGHRLAAGLQPLSLPSPDAGAIEPAAAVATAGSVRG
jgi:peptidoglycan/LPS O-acetylase OafA/YrhL